MRHVLVAVAPRCFVDNLAGAWFRRSGAAALANTDRNRGAAMDVTPVAPLGKRYVFKVLDDLPFAPKAATDRRILDRHSSVS
jgi:hypothetical protein